MVLPRAYPSGAGGGGGVTDHGALTGLTDDDHPQYVLASGARAFTGAQQFIAGTAGAPGVAVGEATSGLFRVSAGILGLSAGGTEFLRSSATQITAAVPILAPAGAVGAPGVAVGEVTSGLFRVSAGVLGLTAGGTEFLRSTTTLATFAVQVLHAAGTAAAPGVAIGAANDGIYRVGAGVLGFTGAGAALGNWSATGLRVGDATAATAMMDVVGRGSFRNAATGNITLQLGSVVSSTALTDATSKQGILAVPHYTNAEEPFGLIYGQSTSSNNSLFLGGGTSILNAATLIRFQVAGNNTTTNGSEVARISIAGLMLQAGVSASASDLLHVYSSTLSADILRCSDSFGTVGVGGVPASTAMLTCYGRGSFTNSAGGNITLLVGSDVSLTTRTNATVKQGVIAVPHYTNAEEPLGVFFMNQTSSTAILAIGGASTATNAVTTLDFYAAANNTTVVGSIVGRITVTGACFGDNASTPLYSLHVRSAGAGSVVSSAVNNVSVGTATVVGAKSTRFFALCPSTAVNTGADFVWGTVDSTIHRAAAFGMALLSTSGSGTTARAYIATKTAEADTVLLERLSVGAAGNVLIAADASAGTALAQLQVIGASGTNLPVVTLTQNDDNEPFVSCVGTSEAGVTKNLSSFVTVDGATLGWMRWEVNGTDVWVKFSAAPVS